MRTTPRHTRDAGHAPAGSSSNVSDSLCAYAGDARAAAARAVAELATRATNVASLESESFRYRLNAAERDRASAEHVAARAERHRAANALRVAMSAYAAELKEYGVPPERMLVAAKTVVRRGAAAGFSAPDVEALVSRVTTWCIAAYYAIPEEPAVRSPQADGRVATACPPPDGSTARSREAERLSWALVMSTRAVGLTGYGEATDELRTATCDYALALKSRGLTLERVVATMVELARAARSSLTARAARETRDEWPALVARVVEWSAAVTRGD